MMMSDMRSDEEGEWHWKLRLAFLFILGHMITLIIPFFSVTFILMEMLGEGQVKGRLYWAHSALWELLIILLLIIIFFSEMLLMFTASFGKLVVCEVVLLVIFYLLVIESNSQELTLGPFVLIILCAALKSFAAAWSESLLVVRREFIGRRPGKVV